MSVTVASAEANVILYDGNALEFSSPLDVVAYANTVYVIPPSEFQITTDGTIWRYNQWIALMSEGNWVEAETTVATTTVGIQFWGDTNDGWARVLVDGVEVWSGDTYGSDATYPGGAFVKYLEVSGLDKETHTIRVESMGIDGPGGSDHVTIFFFALMDPSAVGTTSAPVSGLVAYYPFDGDVKDYSGNDNHGTPMGNMVFSSGVVGSSAATFDGKSHIEVQDSDSLDLTEDFTFTGWLNKEDAGVGGWAVVFSKGDTSSQLGSSSPYALFHSSNGVNSGVRIAGQNIVSNAETDFNEWYFVAVTKDGSELKFYINGELKDTKTTAVSIPRSDTKLLIGIDPPGVTEYFKGSMDDLRIYNIALSQSEISAIYQGASVPTSTPTSTPTTGTTSVSKNGLVAYYPFDGDARDYSGNNNHGTNNGATFVSGTKGQALSFDGTDDYVRSPVNINPDTLPQLTIVAWVKSDLESRTVISHDNGGYDRTIAIDNRGGGLGWSAFTGSGGVLGFHPATIGEWTFIATVYDQDTQTITLYVNDKVYTEKGVLSGGWDYTNIGSNPSYGGNFDGVIDEVRIYSVALSQSEINAIRQGAAVPTQTPTTQDPVADKFTGLTFESRSKATGSSVQIPLTLYGVRENIGNMDMTLRYDSSVLEATEVVKGSLTGDSLYDYNIIDGTIKVSLADKAGFSGDGSVVQVRFDVIGAEGSSSDLDIVSLSANRADLTSVSIATKDGVFTVVGLDESRGDAEGDGGELTALDALYALQMAVGKIPEDLAMDMNGDGSVTSIDARQILRSSAKLE
ncbi:LamG-like jellyroll fold domain-containing protein [Methanolobus sp. WCC4]|uniref:LamG-like jellyroll fold domain-containing protein n=1 Tax=Methanolobus sp. WCC4 TaxID=3125784 RepID=UPI0030F8A543